VTKKKSRITLIGTLIAKPGLEFIYEGEPEECKVCRVRKTCHNLETGRRYRITDVRDTPRHACRIHMDKVIAVDVTEAPVTAMLSADMAIIDTKLKYEYPCTRTECENYDLCHPEGIIEGETYIVEEILGSGPDDCSKGRALKVVSLMPA